MLNAPPWWFKPPDDGGTAYSAAYTDGYTGGATVKGFAVILIKPWAKMALSLRF